MSLDYVAIQQQAQTMQQVLADRENLRAEHLQVALDWLRRYAEEFELLQTRVDQANHAASRQQASWTGAALAPGRHALPLTMAIDAPDCPDAVTVIGVDGSQITPNRHHGELYYLINAGGIVVQSGTGAAPQCSRLPKLHFDEESLFPNEELILPGVVNMERDWLMMDHLAALVESYAALAEHLLSPSVVALVDGPLLLWGHQRSQAPYQLYREEDLAAYLNPLGRVRRAGAAPCGYIDCSGSRGVMRLLSLAALDLAPGEVLTADCFQTAEECLQGVVDRDVYAHVLRPGQRSALFVTQSPINAQYGHKGHEVWFFYLNVSPREADGASGEWQTIARVELPAWAAQAETLLNLMHAVLYAQCQVVPGCPYPYVLLRADELARIDSLDKDYVDRLVAEHALAARGRVIFPSDKQQAKALTQRRSVPHR